MKAVKAIVCSTRDTAGMNMFNFFLEKGFKQMEKTWEGMNVFQKESSLLVRTNNELVYADNLNDLDVEEIIFASKHKSVSGKPTLTTHFCGNFGPADLGGTGGQLSVASANTMCNIYRQMVKNPFEQYIVSLEASHHGPLINIPHCWVELGNSEKQWKDEEVAAFLVDSIMRGIEDNTQTLTAIGIGGNHYCSVFSRLEGEYAFGHILPKYAQPYLNKEMIEQMIEKTFPKPKKIVIDKKGLREQSNVQKTLRNYELVIV